MPGVKRAHESDGEDFDEETTSESEISSDEDAESTSDFVSEDAGFASDDDNNDGSNGEGSSEPVMNDMECEKRLNACLAAMSKLENKFLHLYDEIVQCKEESKRNIEWIQSLEIDGL